jgi:outer membrane receptor protein involved in Fe transport
MYGMEKVPGKVMVFLLLFMLMMPAAAEAGLKDGDDHFFKMSLEELLEVEINTAARTGQKIADIPASVVLITRGEIETFGYRTLAEILEHIPGLYAIDDYAEGGLNFGVRGFWSGQVNDNMIILVNGVHHVNDLFSNYPLTKIAVPVEAIERVEVIRGPMSVIYGNGAFYGVVNIITAEPEGEPLNLLSGTAGSPGGSRSLFLRVSGNTGGFRYNMNASVADYPGIDKPLTEMVSEPDILPALGVPRDARTGGRQGNRERYFNFSGSFKEFSLDISYSNGNEEFYFLLPSVAEGTEDRFSSTHISARYRKKASRHLALEGKLTFSHVKDIFTYHYLYEGFYGIELLDTGGWEAELNVYLEPSKKWSLTGGLYYRSVFETMHMYDLPSFDSVELENNLISLAKGDQIETRALFAQVNASLSRNIKVVAGLRLEQTPPYRLRMKHAVGGAPPEITGGEYRKSDIEVIPRLAVLYYISKHSVFKFLYGEAINRPSFAQNTWNSLNPRFPTLEPERIRTLELNYIGAYSSRFTVNASLFRNRLDKLITRVVEFDENKDYESWSANAGEMVTTGVELTIKSEPLPRCRLEMSGIYQHTKDKRQGFEGIEVAYSPEILGYIKASYHGKRFKIGITGNYVGPMEPYWDETRVNREGALGARIGEKTGGHFLTGINVRIEDLFMKGFFLGLKCSNLLNAEVRYPTTTVNDWLDLGALGMGRAFWVSAGFKF